jgi:hypothetical protein
LVKVCLWHLLEQGILVKAGLNSIDPNLLLEISHIQACQKNWAVNETANLVSTCNCLSFLFITTFGQSLFVAFA